MPLKAGNPIKVTWVDPSIDTDCEGRPEDIPAEDLETQTTDTIGWFVKEEKGVLVIAVDTYPLAEKGPTFRCIQRIHKDRVQEIRKLSLGRLAYSTVKARSGSTRRRQGRISK